MSFIASFFDEIFALKNPFTFPWGRLVMPMLTLIGAWGGFPDSPKMFKTVTKWRPFQYFFLWVLVMQGGASADPGLSLIAVLIFVVVTELIKGIEGEEKFEMYGNKDVVSEY
jgi:hypothetical protein